MHFRRTLAATSFAFALIVPCVSFADESTPGPSDTEQAPAETGEAAPEATEIAPVPAETAEESETSDELEDAGAAKRHGRRLELPQVSLPIHAAERAVERVAFAHERRDLKRAAAAEKHAARKTDDGADTGQRKQHAIDHRAAAAALRESARERRAAAHERQTVAKEKRSVAEEQRAAAQSKRADAGEKREAAKERKAGGKRPEK